MNKPLISAGVALSAVGLMAVAPAQAGTLTFDFEIDTASTVTFGPLLGGLSLGGFGLDGVTVPDSLGVTAEGVAGNFTVLDDSAQFIDGSIDLDYDGLVEDVLSSSYVAMAQAFLGNYGLTASQVVESVDALFDVDQFTGGGVLESKDFTLLGNPSPFNISYDGETNSLAIDGYSTEVAESCLSTTCLLDGNVSFGVSLVLSELVTVTGDLLANSSLSLGQETRAAIANLQQMATIAQLFGPTVSLSSVTTEFSAITDLASSDPAGSELAFEVTDGLVTATATSGTEQAQIFSQSLAPVEKTPVAGELAADAIVASTSAIAPGGSLTVTTGPITRSTALVTSAGGSDAQDVPEPSILVALLGLAGLVFKRNRKQVVTR
ncbi:MAG: PEP-CTERM sorting domain-containing protein [Cyanobacteria bacterium J06607_17]